MTTTKDIMTEKQSSNIKLKRKLKATIEMEAEKPEQNGKKRIAMVTDDFKQSVVAFLGLSKLKPPKSKSYSMKETSNDQTNGLYKPIDSELSESKQSPKKRNYDHISYPNAALSHSKTTDNSDESDGSSLVASGRNIYFYQKSTNSDDIFDDLSNDSELDVKSKEKDDTLKKIKTKKRKSTGTENEKTEKKPRKTSPIFKESPPKVKSVITEIQKTSPKPHKITEYRQRLDESFDLNESNASNISVNDSFNDQVWRKPSRAYESPKLDLTNMKLNTPKSSVRLNTQNSFRQNDGRFNSANKVNRTRDQWESSSASSIRFLGSEIKRFDSWNSLAGSNISLTTAASDDEFAYLNQRQLTPKLNRRQSNHSTFSHDRPNSHSWFSQTLNKFCSNDSEKNPVPNCLGFQFLGDSQFCRLSMNVLRQKDDRVGEKNSRRVGYCVSGQTIEDLHKRIGDVERPLSKKLVLMIGTNNLRRNEYPHVMIAKMKLLIDTIKTNLDKMFILTLPPILCMESSGLHWRTLNTFNQYLMTTYKDDPQITVVDTCPLFLTAPNKCERDYFEKFYGNTNRRDELHLNRTGLRILLDKIKTNIYEFHSEDPVKQSQNV